jgi:hypothetical protein
MALKGRFLLGHPANIAFLAEIDCRVSAARLPDLPLRARWVDWALGYFSRCPTSALGNSGA